MLEGALHEIGQHHAVAAGLPRSHGVEEAHHDDRLLFLLPIGERQKFVERLGSRVAPAALRRGAEDQVGIFVERHLGVLPVDFGSGGQQNKLLFLPSGFEDQLRAVDIGLNRADGALHDELHADGGSEMNDDVGIIDEFRKEVPIFDAVKVILQVFGTLQVPDVLHASGGEIVQQHDLVALFRAAVPQDESR